MQFLCLADVRCRLGWSNESHSSSGKARFPLQNAEAKTSAPTQKFSWMANVRMKEKTEVKEAQRSNCVMATRIEAWFAPLQWHHTAYLNLSSLSSFHADQRLRECKMVLLEWNDIEDLPLPVGRSQWWMRVGWERCWPVKERDQMRFGEEIRSSLGRNEQQKVDRWSTKSSLLWVWGSNLNGSYICG